MARMRTEGGKAENLQRLLDAGAPVPPFAVLSGEWSERCMAAMGCQPVLAAFDAAAERWVRAELSDSGTEGGALLGAQAAALGAVAEMRCLASKPLPRWALKGLFAAARRIASRPRRPQSLLVLRSSASVEDRAESAFPGQFETIIGIAGGDELAAAARRCLAGWLSPASAHYRLGLRSQEVLGHLYGYPVSLSEWRDILRPHRRAPLPAYDVERALVATRGLAASATAGKLALVVQEMVSARAAGVAFFPGPGQGQEDVCVVEATVGLGGSLVDAEVVPDRWLFSSDGLLRERTLGSKCVTHVLAAGEARRVPTPPAERAGWAVENGVAASVAVWTRRLRDEFGWAGIDVEWAFDGDLALVQARPQTGLAPVRVLGVDAAAAGQPWYTGGVIASPGAASGLLIVAERPEDVPPGVRGILAVPGTEKRWEGSGALLGAAAIIAEQGGSLSHAAIYSRERGLPCVIGAAGAIERLASRAGAVVTLDAMAAALWPGALPLSERLLRTRSSPSGVDEGFATAERSGWGRIIGDRRCLVRVRPPFRCQWTMDTYVEAFRQVDARFRCRHDVLTPDDGGLYTRFGEPRELYEALDNLTLDEMDQLLDERESDMRRFLDLSFAEPLNVAAWTAAHVQVVAFQHISFTWAEIVGRRLDRALDEIDPDTRKALLTAGNRESENSRAERALALLAPQASRVRGFVRADAERALALARIADPALAEAIEGHARWYRCGSADPSTELPVLNVVRSIQAVLGLQTRNRPTGAAPAEPVGWERHVSDAESVRKLLGLAARMAAIRESEHHLKMRGLRRATDVLERMGQVPRERLRTLTLVDLVATHPPKSPGRSEE
jgi:phosphohistidine swiveling domain-containing protein